MISILNNKLLLIVCHSDDRGFTVLHHACTTGDLQLVEYLQLEGAATPTRVHFGLSPGDVLPTGSFCFSGPSFDLITACNFL